MSTDRHVEKEIPLYLLDELEAAERARVEAHLEACPRCQAELRAVASLHRTLQARPRWQPGEPLLQRLRGRLSRRLRQERGASRAPARAGRWRLLPRPALVWNLAWVAAALVVGVLVGRSWRPVEPGPADADLAHVEEMREPLIADIDFIDFDPQSGQVAIRFKRVQDLLVRGEVQDARIQTLLAHAVRTEANPGRRLAAVKVLRQSAASPDEDVVDALIHAMKRDSVAGVRLRAAQALKGLVQREPVRRAFVAVLLRDPNPAVRIQAIEALGRVPNVEEVAPYLQAAGREDENAYIRLRAGELLQNQKMKQKLL